MDCHILVESTYHKRDIVWMNVCTALCKCKVSQVLNYDKRTYNAPHVFQQYCQIGSLIGNN